MFSDTPQGGIDGVQLAGDVGTAGTLSDDAYLTNATHITESPAATHDTLTHGNITNQHGTITNTFGNVTQQHGDIVETYNKTGDKADHVDADGWEKTDNVNTHTGTVQNDNTTNSTGTVVNAGGTSDTGTIVNAGSTSDTGTINKVGSVGTTGNATDDGTDTYTKHEYGKIGVGTYQEMVIKWRESFLNIDMQIINSLGDLFMKVW